jgi:hypothetical protein
MAEFAEVNFCRWCPEMLDSSQLGLEPSTTVVNRRLRVLRRLARPVMADSH